MDEIVLKYFIMKLRQKVNIKNTYIMHMQNVGLVLLWNIYVYYIGDINGTYINYKQNIYGLYMFHICSTYILHIYF